MALVNGLPGAIRSAYRAKFSRRAAVSRKPKPIFRRCEIDLRTREVIERGIMIGWAKVERVGAGRGGTRWYNGRWLLARGGRAGRLSAACPLRVGGDACRRSA